MVCCDFESVEIHIQFAVFFRHFTFDYEKTRFMTSFFNDSKIDFLVFWQYLIFSVTEMQFFS